MNFNILGHEAVTVTDLTEKEYNEYEEWTSNNPDELWTVGRWMVMRFCLALEKSALDRSEVFEMFFESSSTMAFAICDPFSTATSIRLSQNQGANR